MKITIADRAGGEQFDIDLRGGTPTPDSILVTEAPDGTDRRIYRVNAVNGSTVEVTRLPISHGVML
jgi:hypothetical protein